jgi:hypothetical protein
LRSTEFLQCPNVKIIVVSDSEKEVEDLRKDIQTNAFIAKPFTNDNLLL